MELTTEQVSSQLYFVHGLSQKYMKNYKLCTTTFILPKEYADCPYGCVGLFAFIGPTELSSNNKIIFGVNSDGSIIEIKERFFPQMMLMLIEQKFGEILAEAEAGINIHN
jgi:hypothetical protein